MEPESEPDPVEFTMAHPIMDDYTGPPQSLFVVVHSNWASRYIRILQLETNNEGYSAHWTPEQFPKVTLNQNAYVAFFNEPLHFPEISWFFSPPTSNTGDLYMVPNFVRDKDIGAPLNGYKFNFRDGTCQPIMPPLASKIYPHVVDWRGHIYFMAHPDWYYDTPDPVFECYDPDKNQWKALEPFPYHNVHLLCGDIGASAVWDDTILYCMGRCQIWAYYVPRDRWYVVNVEDNRCYTIVGDAIVLKNTIYALTRMSRDLVLALSIKREEIDGEPVFTCSLCSEILVPGMGETAYEIKDSYKRYRRLVHLGEVNFCLVQSCKLFGSHTEQPIQVTSLKLISEKSLTVTNLCVYQVKIPHGGQFEVGLCFSLPVCKTTAFNKGEGVESFFSLDLEDYASKQKDKTDFDPGPVQEDENVTLPEDENVTPSKDEEAEGHSIIVRNLPLYVAFGELRELLINFGPIKKDGIRVRSNKREKRCYAFVEFESEISMQRAIKESSIIINGCRVIIKDKRSIGLTRVDSSRTSGGSSSARGKVSRSKMTISEQDWENLLYGPSSVSSARTGSSARTVSVSGSGSSARSVSVSGSGSLSRSVSGTGSSARSGSGTGSSARSGSGSGSGSSARSGSGSSARSGSGSSACTGSGSSARSGSGLSARSSFGSSARSSSGSGSGSSTLS